MKKIYIFALLLAILTGVAVYVFASKLEQAAQPANIPTVTVVVATTPIAENVYITNDMLALKTVPAEFAAPNAISTIGDAVGKVNIYRAYAGQQIVLDQLGSTEEAAVSEGGRLSYTLTEGMRAYTLYTTEITGIAGYVMPGDRVDAVCSINVNSKDEEGSNISTPTTMMLFENVKVLETGTILRKLATEEEGKLYTSVTLEITPDQAMKLQYAVSYGGVTLMLRPVEDEKIVSPNAYTGEGTK